jgi:gliding motility-associated protein GldM
MALPKEPRQKMINIMYLVLTAILALNVSAEVIEAFKTVDKSLQNSSSNISAANKTIYESLKDKLSDEKTREKATIWQPKAEQARKYTEDVTAYIESLKVSLKQGAGLRMKEKDGKMVEDFKEDNLDASTRLFETGKKGEELKAKLEEFKKNMLAIDPSIKASFEKNFPVNTDAVEGKEGKKDFTSGYFHMTPTVAALTMLSKFQNNVKNAENQVVSFCHEQIGQVKLQFNKFEPIVTASASYLMPNDELMIQAGVGAFNNSASPKVYFNGSAAQMNENGVGTYKNKVTSSGSVSVVVEYTKPDGTTTKTEPQVIKYTVGQASSATVSLDKMDVFYVGLDNPITISSPTGMDRTSVVGSGCTIKGAGSSRTVSVSGTGTCSITVSPQGSTPYSHTYRIKRIPEPSFMIGGGKPRMPSVEFKGQQFCRADMGPDFIYDVRYSVVSATVYFSGANFPNVVTSSITGNSLSGLDAYIKRCGPGSVVSFDNIKVSGPDGTRVIEGKSFALY